MDANSYLNPTTIKNQCKSGINILYDNNELLNVAEKKFVSFAEEEGLQSNSFDTLKQQISDYQIVIRTLRVANEADIRDFITLRDAVGEEILSGEDVFFGKQSATESRRMNEINMKKCYIKAASAENFWVEWYYNWKRNYYESQAVLDQKLYEQYQKKENAYDEIEIKTKGLFSEAHLLEPMQKWV
jgi:hypothetical protein